MVSLQLEACVLYIEPTSKMIGLSCRPHLVTPHLAPRNLFGNLEVGQILREAQVVHADKKHGLVLRVAPKTFARSPVSPTPLSLHGGGSIFTL